jgi:hypothetical protein
MIEIKRKKLLVILMTLMDEKDSVMLKRRIWCCQWLLRREERGAYHTILREFAIEDTPGFDEYMKMPCAKFVELAGKKSFFIVKQETCMRKSIHHASERLALAITYLVTGETFQSLSSLLVPVLDRNNDNISDCDGSMCRYLPCVWNTAEME